MQVLVPIMCIKFKECKKNHPGVKNEVEEYGLTICKIDFG